MVDYALWGPAYPMLHGQGDPGSVERGVGLVVGGLWILVIGLALAVLLLPLAAVAALFDRVTG